jgi:diaminohydroxyphosphoribosylaminopyrimidine deaminase / 5-amino-6-(5-phosphoribosylamino)uracil reductase
MRMQYSDEYYMKRALQLAEKGWGKTNPNPLVGAVLVKDGRIIAEGFHERLGEAHAEAAALQCISEDPGGSTLYVNLEPCSHCGRTPPCAAAVVASGIGRVVIAMEDPNPKVAGRGIRMLEEAGIEVVTGVLQKEAEKLNEIFIKYITQQKPFVILKSAMTLDGKIASVSGDSRWISGEVSRQFVHGLRNRVSGIMVGIQTVLQDNPLLTTRLPGGEGRDAVRIVVDSSGRIPLDCKLLNPALSKARVILATTSKIRKEKEERLRELGVTIVKLDGDQCRVNLPMLMEELHRQEMDSILLEGGGTLNAAALEQKIIDKAVIFIAPRFIGGEHAPTLAGGPGRTRMADAIRLKDMVVEMCGEDIKVEGYIENEQ